MNETCKLDQYIAYLEALAFSLEVEAMDENISLIQKVACLAKANGARMALNKLEAILDEPKKETGRAN